MKELEYFNQEDQSEQLQHQRNMLDPLEDHPYLEFPPESDAALCCEKLWKMHLGAHFVVCWDTLRTLAAEDWAREFIPRGSPWDRLFELSYMPTYREILVEFLSSF
ncbi:hypothetical protein Hanom_Chr08g00722831 [Helianthus anomalus]